MERRWHWMGRGPLAFRVRAWSGFVTIVVLVACHTPSARDGTAGINGTTNATPEWSEGEAWTVSGSPSVEIGSSTGGDAYELYRVSGAAVLAAQIIVVANNGSQELRFFDKGGAMIKRIGREGAGPGEFRGLSWIRRWAGDSIAAWDWSLMRLTIFDADGRLGRIISFGPFDGIPGLGVEGFFDDGSFLASVAHGDPLPPTGIQRHFRTLYHVAADGRSFADSIGHIEIQTMVTFRTGSAQLLSERMRFSPTTFIAVEGDVHYVGWSERYRIDVRDPMG